MDRRVKRTEHISKKSMTHRETGAAYRNGRIKFNIVEMKEEKKRE